MNIVNIYDKYIDSLNQDNTKERYKGKENWFHASSSGSCIRKQYYRHVEKVPEPSFPKDTMRLFRLGNLVHDDIHKKFKIISGDLNKFNEPINYYLQLATYAYWYERESGKELSKMSLLYYNKDTSEMHEIEVDKNYIHQAQSYWLSVKEKVNYEPDIQLGVSPREKWECNYCNYYQHCGEGYTDGKRKNFK